MRKIGEKSWILEMQVKAKAKSKVSSSFEKLSILIFFMSNSNRVKNAGFKAINKCAKNCFKVIEKLQYHFY